jgi:aarF domain-containing kinase
MLYPVGLLVLLITFLFISMTSCICLFPYCGDVLSLIKGNILLCRRPSDGQPQLGLIDYGQVKRLTKETRHLFSKLIIALANEDEEQIRIIMKQAGYQSKYMNPNNMYLYAKVYYDEDNPSLTNGLHIQMFIEQLQSIDPIQHLPQEFISIGRMSIVLRGLAHSLHQSRSIAQAWKPIAERVLREDI